MAQTISATDTELQKPVNVIFEQTFLRNAKARCPYFMGTQKGSIAEHSGTSTIKWRRIENLTPTTTALSELTGTASYMQGRDSEAASFSDVTATVGKYGQFYILNEEADLMNYNGQTAKLVETLSISAGRSLNQLQRNVIEDNATVVYANGGSDSAVNTGISVNDVKNVINTINRNSGMTFTPMTTGSTNIATTPILPAYWGVTHPDVAVDIAGLTGFTSVEKYAGQVDTVMGEFGTLSVAGQAVRFVQSEDASIDTDVGATGGSGMRETTNSKADLYHTVVYGMDAVGSVGFGEEHTDGIYRAGDNLSCVELILKEKGSGGTSDPLNEISTLGWKSWHSGAILNANWARTIRSGASSLS